MGLDKPAGDRPNVHAADRGQRREQRELGSGKGFIAQRHQQRDKRRRPHSPAQVFKEHGGCHGIEVLIGNRQQPVASVGDPLQHTEDQQRPKQRQPLHQDPAVQGAENGGKQA